MFDSLGKALAIMDRIQQNFTQPDVNNSSFTDLLLVTLDVQTASEMTAISDFEKKLISDQIIESSQQRLRNYSNLFNIINMAVNNITDHIIYNMPNKTNTTETLLCNFENKAETNKVRSPGEQEQEDNKIDQVDESELEDAQCDEESCHYTPREARTVDFQRPSLDRKQKKILFDCKNKVSPLVSLKRVVVTERICVEDNVTIDDTFVENASMFSADNKKLTVSFGETSFGCHPVLTTKFSSETTVTIC